MMAMMRKMVPLMAPEGRMSGGGKAPPEGIMKRKQLNILVADDYRNVLRMMSMVLSGLGHNPITARDGKEALETFILSKERGEPIDFIITDYKMPKMDGLELLRELKKIAPEVPVIVMTAHFKMIDTEVFKEAGALAVMDKDIGIPDLENAVKLATASVNYPRLKSDRTSKRSMDH
jgi:CheY-like chemotaxis protein